MASWICASCEGENPEGMRFCGHCGTAQDAAPTVAEPAETQAEDVAGALRSFVAGPVADRLVEAGGRLPEERRLVTALFADVSGFTSLADRLDPEQLLEVIDPVIAGLSSIVGRYEGYVEKFAGDALLALFGAPVAHEDDASRALLVALEMHEELEKLCATLPHEPELTVHIGVNSGHGIARILGSEARMDYAVLGDSVILAQRLESAAPAGETYVSELTMRLAEDGFEFEPVGELTLKGKAEPVPAWRLVGKREAARAAGTTRLIGREQELEEIVSPLTPAADRGAAAAVLGEPGVGKSKLAEAARARLEEAGVRWLETRCLSYGAGLAYRPFVELLRQDADIGPDPYFARLTGEETYGQLGDLEPEAFRRGLHAALGEWLTRLARTQPTVVAIEDLHWADASSLALLEELVQLTATEPIGFFFAARPEALERLEGLTQAAPAHALIRLDALDEPGVEALISSVLDAPAPAELASFVATRSGGNPLFVRELVRSLQDSGTLLFSDGSWHLLTGWDEKELPPTIEEVLAARIDLLPRAAASVLATASVIGRRVGMDLLSAVLDDPPDLDASLDALVTAGFLDRAPGGGYESLVFHHALVQDVAYARLLRRRRRELHRRVAEVAEHAFGEGDNVIDLLARHLYLGEAGEKAVEYLRLAGERSQRLYANEEAILHFSRACALASDDAELRLQLAELRELVGDYPEALELYRQVRDATGDVRAWRGEASTLRKRGEYVAALAVIAEALGSDSVALDDPTPLRLERGLTLASAGRFGEAIDVFEAGLEPARARGGAIAGHMLLGLARAETIEERLESALSHALEAESIFEQAGDVRALATTMRLLGDLHRNRGELDDAARDLRRGLELAERTGSVEEIGGCLINLSLVEIERELLEDSIACSRRAIEEFERIGHPAGLAFGYGNLAYALSLAGEFDEAYPHSQRALELAESIGNGLAIADIRDTIAQIRFGQERYVEAAEEAEQAAAKFLELGATSFATKSFNLAAVAWEQAGESERARASEARARDLVSA